MKSKNFLIFLIVGLFLVNISYGSYFADEKIEVREATAIIESNMANPASFTLNIKNIMDENQDFFIAKAFFSPEWRVIADPYIVNLDSDEIKSVNVKVFPKKLMSLGEYNIPIPIQSRDNKVDIKYNLGVVIIPGSENIIKMDILMDDSLDLRVPNTVKINLENIGNYELRDAYLELKSSIFSAKRYIHADIGEKKLESFVISLEEDAKPDDYILHVEVRNANEEIVGQANKKFVLASFVDVSEKVVKENTLWRNVIVLERENSGTLEKEEKITVKLNWIDKFFTSYSMEPNYIEKKEDGYYVTWDFVLKPNEKAKISVETNYKYLFWGAGVLIIIALFFLYSYYSKVSIVKRVMDVDKSREAISGIKVMLYVKNKSGKEIEKLRVIDYLPKLIAASGKDFGTMRPSKTQVSSTGRMRLIWEFENVENNDERIITYVARSKLSIIGKLNLPNAIVEYFTKRGKPIRRKSNKLTLLTSVEQKEE